jgi:beta-lactamase regulating signal transducer with metallopeptidase domain
MNPVELLGLSLLVSVGVAGLGWLAASALEGVSGDVRLREGAWRATLFLPVLPPAAMVLFLLTPAPVRPVSILPTARVAEMSVDLADIAPATETFRLDGEQAAMVVLAAALALALLRLAILGWRARRVGRLLASATTASSPTLRTVGDVARRLGVAAPEVRVFNGGSEALLTGLVRPVLVLPSSLAEASDAPAARAVIAHELAHLKRGDHRAVWGEEGLLVLLAFNPFLPFVRARRAAAREEACDALALLGAGAETRRAYARSLVEALRARADSSPTPTPALTFTGNPRSQAMRRLQSILTPPAAAGRSIRFAAMGAVIALLALTGLGTAAVASQAASSASSANTTRLTVEISQDKYPFILGSSDVLLVSLAGEAEGEVLSKTVEAPILLGQGLPGRVFLDLDERFFPSRMPGRAYELKAEVRGANGRVAYASEPTTLRLAPRSQGRVARMRPQLILHPLS